MAHERPVQTTFSFLGERDLSDSTIVKSILWRTQDIAHELMKTDLQRDALRAYLSDDTLHKKIAAAKTPDERVLATEAWEKRIKRRVMEKRVRGAFTPPGEWDSDLDTYNEDMYEMPLEGGYTGLLWRNKYLSWNGYVKLPWMHSFENKDAHFFSHGLPEGMPAPPVKITYGADGIFGFDYAQADDVKPYQIHSLTDYVARNHYDTSNNGQGYVPFDVVFAKVSKLAEYFRKIELSHYRFATRKTTGDMIGTTTSTTTSATTSATTGDTISATISEANTIAKQYREYCTKHLDSLYGIRWRRSATSVVTSAVLSDTTNETVVEEISEPARKMPRLRLIAE